MTLFREINTVYIYLYFKPSLIISIFSAKCLFLLNHPQWLLSIWIGLESNNSFLVTHPKNIFNNKCEMSQHTVCQVPVSTVVYMWCIYSISMLSEHNDIKNLFIMLCSTDKPFFSNWHPTDCVPLQLTHLPQI